MSRPRAADDFAMIRARMEELRREREQSLSGHEACTSAVRFAARRKRRRAPPPRADRGIAAAVGPDDLRQEAAVVAVSGSSRSPGTAPCVPPSCQRPAFFSASATSGGMYFSSCLARTLVAAKTPSAAQPSLGNDPLAFAEQIRQHPVINDRNGGLAVGDSEIDAAPVRLTSQTLRFDEPADPDAALRADRLSGQIARAVEEHEVVVERGQHQRGRRGQQEHADPERDQPPPLARHRPGPPARSPRSCKRSSAASLIRWVRQECQRDPRGPRRRPHRPATRMPHIRPSNSIGRASGKGQATCSP